MPAPTDAQKVAIAAQAFQNVRDALEGKSKANISMSAKDDAIERAHHIAEWGLSEMVKEEAE